jgi:hypothetical protein
MTKQEDGNVCDLNEIMQDQLDININGKKSTQIDTNSKQIIAHIFLSITFDTTI